jgi:hypothetical protein
MMKRPRQKDDRHLSFIRLLPCTICGDNTTVEAAHIRYPDPRAAKRQTGKGERPDDKWTIPMCGNHHRLQHEFGDEEMFWRGVGCDPIFIALALYSVSGNHELGCQIIEANQQ